MSVRLRVCLSECIGCAHVAFVRVFVHVHALPFSLDGLIKMNDRVHSLFFFLIQFMFSKCYNSIITVEQNTRVIYICMQIHKYYMLHTF